MDKFSEPELNSDKVALPTEKPHLLSMNTDQYHATIARETRENVALAVLFARRVMRGECTTGVGV